MNETEAQSRIDAEIPELEKVIEIARVMPRTPWTPVDFWRPSRFPYTR